MRQGNSIEGAMYLQGPSLGKTDRIFSFSAIFDSYETGK